MTTFDQIKQIIRSYGVAHELVTPEATIDEDMGLHSLDTFLIVIEAEEKFGVHITDDVLTSILTVQDAVDAVDHALSNWGSGGMTSDHQITIRVEDGKKTVLLGIAFGLCAGLIAGFVITVLGQAAIDDKREATGLFTHDGKVFQLTEIHR
jgi:acyl carrier protein